MEVLVEKKFCLAHNKLCIFVSVSPLDGNLKQALKYHGVKVHSFDHLSEFLRALFVEHGKFYSALSYQYSETDHPDHNTFDEGCDGFRYFLKNRFNVSSLNALNQQQLQEIANAIAIQLQNYLSVYFTDLNTYVSAISVISTSNKNKEKQYLVYSPYLLQNALLVTQNKVYSVILQETEYQSVQDVFNDVVNSVNKSYEMQLQAQTTVLQNRIKELEKQIIEIKEKAFLEGLKTFEALKAKGWELERGELVLKKIIKATHIKASNLLYALTPDHNFYVKNIHIAIESVVNSARAEEAFHPNVNNGTVCLGDLQGKRLVEVLNAIENSLKVINLDSAYDNEATKVAKEILKSLKSEGSVWTA